MDRKEAFRRLSDVVNLQDGVATAEQVVVAVDDKIAKAEAHLAAAEACQTKAEDQLDRERARLAEAQAAAAGIPPDLVEELAREIGAKRSTRDRYLAALADAGDDDEQVRAVLASAAEIGLVGAQAGVATGNGEGNGL